ncbi:focal adhesion protein tensin isoform 1-T2 [Cochliomyia hominivorax]
MRSHYDDFAAAGETNKLSSKTTTTINYNNNTNQINNNNSFINNNNNSNGAIPYHARENSLPFSYGQINKTSTPLRPTHNTTSSMLLSSSSTSTLTRNNYSNSNEYDFDFDFDFGLNTLQRSNKTHDLDYGYGKNHNNYLTSHNRNGDIVNHAPNGNRVKDNNNYNLNESERERERQRDRDHDLNQYYGSLNNKDKYLNDIYSIRNNSEVKSNNYNTNTDSVSDEKMIKSQPRLTSPLLVRKTLSNGQNVSRSPTRSTANTIANTYHFSYGNNSNNKNTNFSGDSNFDKFGLNGNNNNNNNNDLYGLKMYNSGSGGGGGGVGTGSDTLPTKTPARHDFDELLRERREKVFNEYRSNSTTTYDLSSSPAKISPVPPPRRFANGTVQLPSTLPPSVGHKSLSTSLYGNQLPPRSQSQNSKYNYDIEFNLNLNDSYNTPRYEDEVDNAMVTRRRTNTIDISPQRQPQKQQQQQQQQPLYQTRDIPLASTYVERNYHTIATTKTSSLSSPNAAVGNRETLSPTSMLDIYSTPYDANNRNKQPLEATTATSTTYATTTLQRSNEYGTTYGNGNLYGHELNNNISSNSNNFVPKTMTDRESSPIYATSTKKVTTTSTLSANTTAAVSPQQPAQRFTNINSNTNTITYNNGPHIAVVTQADYPSPTSGQRPETPAFPVTPRTPFANGHSGTLNKQITTVTYQQQQQQQQQQQPIYQSPQTANEHSYSSETIYGTNYRPRLNSSLSMANSEPQEVAAHLVKFAKDSSKFWYKPNLSRDEAISLLINATPGTFVVRDSTTYKHAYGLVLRVAQPPPGSTTTGKPDELVRHFLIEPTTRGVRLKGCNNEPVFTSLSALVYEHSINQLALPCLLRIPEQDLVPPLVEHTPAQKQLLTQGAACNVLWLFSCDTESLTGEEAIRKAIRQMYNLPSPPTPTEVHFKVTQQGITLTDNTRKKFFRKHYTADIISYCAIDPDHRLWTMQEHGNDNTTVVGSMKKTIFAFVARRSASSKDNQCHIFCDLAINQPASAIVSFVNKTLPTEKQKNYIL